MVVSHALSLILSTCSPHPSLLSALLDVSLSHGLTSESHVLLRALFETAFEPTPSSGTLHSILSPTSPRIIHSAHSSYRSALRDMCCTAVPASHLSPIMNDRTLVRILTEVLENTPVLSRAAVWTCKSTVRLARQLRKHSFGAFIQLVTALLCHVASFSANRKGKTSLGKARQDPWEDRMLSRLAKWIDMTFQHLHANTGATFTNASYDVDTDTLDEFHMVVELLIQARCAGLHLNPHVNGEQELSARILSNAIICLSTTCLSSPLHASIPEYDKRELLALLHDSRPNGDTYNTLVALAFPGSSHSSDELSGIRMLPPALYSAMSILHAHATFLRKKQCFLLEASLWSNALSCLETLCPEFNDHHRTADHGLDLPPNTPKSRNVYADELENLRVEIIGLVDTAERRCFGDEKASGVSFSCTPRKRQGVHGKEGEWRWEEMIGCWILKTPATAPAQKVRKRQPQGEDEEQAFVKRKRIGQGQDGANSPSLPLSLSKRTNTGDQSRAWSITSTSTSSYTSARSSRMSHSRSPRRLPLSISSSLVTTPSPSTPSFQPYSSKGGECDFENENPGVSLPVARHKLKVIDLLTGKPPLRSRRLSSFETLLSDALTNSTDLHPKDGSKMRGGRRNQRVSQVNPTQNLQQVIEIIDSDTDEQPGLAMDDSERGVPRADQLSSDDVLDLFAYMSSEC